MTRRDELIAPLADRGLDAIEVYHSDHTAEDVGEYRNLATRLNLLISGGSDFHGEDTTAMVAGKPPRPHRSTLGVVRLPPENFAALEARVRLRQGCGGQASR